VKKVALYFLFVLGLFAISGNMLWHPAVSKQLIKQEQGLSYTIASDCQSPFELRQVNLLPASVAGVSFSNRSVSALRTHFSDRVVLKHRAKRYPLFIKDQIGGPVFLRNNCLRI
jgi:hypothetical protein